ncbi:hypothetical protein GQR58_005904 [Nymphon striatum]|nr:hypothetical protein GQR58_005904 [Nymphon striatum]
MDSVDFLNCIGVGGFITLSYDFILVLTFKFVQGVGIPDSLFLSNLCFVDDLPLDFSLALLFFVRLLFVLLSIGDASKESVSVMPWFPNSVNNSSSLQSFNSRERITPFEKFKDLCGLTVTGILRNNVVLRSFEVCDLFCVSTSISPENSFLTDFGSPPRLMMVLFTAKGDSLSRDLFSSSLFCLMTKNFGQGIVSFLELLCAANNNEKLSPQLASVFQLPIVCGTQATYGFDRQTSLKCVLRTQEHLPLSHRVREQLQVFSSVQVFGTGSCVDHCGEYWPLEFFIQPNSSGDSCSGLDSVAENQTLPCMCARFKCRSKVCSVGGSASGFKHLLNFRFSFASRFILIVARRRFHVSIVSYNFHVPDNPYKQLIKTVKFNTSCELIHSFFRTEDKQSDVTLIAWERLRPPITVTMESDELKNMYENRPHRIKVIPLDELRAEVSTLGKRLENLLRSFDEINKSKENIHNHQIKETRKKFIEYSDKLTSRLHDNGNIEESKENNDYKVFIIGEIYRHLTDSNNSRITSDHDVSINSNLEDLTLFSGSHEKPISPLHSQPVLSFSNVSGYQHSNVDHEPSLLNSNVKFTNVVTGSIPAVMPPFTNINNNTPFSNSPNSMVGRNSIPTYNNAISDNATFNHGFNPMHSTANYFDQIPTADHPVFPQHDTTAIYLVKQQLLQPPVKPFDGSSSTYKMWSSLLKTRIFNIPLSAFEKLQILSAHTTGLPREIVQDYIEGSGQFVNDSTVDLVWDIFNERFGSSLRSAELLTQRIKNFPQIKSCDQKQELGRLIDLCRLVVIQLPQNPELSHFNHKEGMCLFWSKLPETLKFRWRTYGMKSKTQNGGRNPTLAIFVRFLQETHAELNDDFFAFGTSTDKYKSFSKVLRSETEFPNQYDSDHSCNENHSNRHSNYTNAERGDNTRPKCPIHKSYTHFLKDCRNFEKLSLQERKKILWENKLCFRCFGFHLVKYCKVDLKCTVCSKNHNTLMHQEQLKSRYGEEEMHKVNDETNNKEIEKIKINLCTEICGEVKTFICSKTLLVNIRHKNIPEKVIQGYAILDEQSTNSFMDPIVLDKLNIEAPSHQYCLNTLSGLKSDISGKIVDGLEVSGILENKWYGLSKVLTNPFIPDTRKEVATPDIIHKHKHLSHLASYFLDLNKDIPVVMLIGADSSDLMHTKCYGTHSPFIHRTPVGWALVGPACLEYEENDKNIKALRLTVEQDNYSYSASHVFPSQNSCIPIPDLFKEFDDDEFPDLSVEDKKFLSIMEGHIEVDKHGTLKMPLPFREEDPHMPDNRAAVYYRTKVALERLSLKSDKLVQCVTSMQKSLERGHVELVPPDQLSVSDGKLWYLPLFAVTHSKKNKARLVFDAAASFHDVNLNQKLLRGPNQTNQLRSVLLRFRRGLIGMTCDVEHMFHNFQVAERHKDYLRFYWYQDNDINRPLVEYRANVHIFGATSSPAVATFGLRYAANECSLPNSEDAREFVLRSFYVDDGLISFDLADQGIKLLNDTKKMLKEFNIRIHKFSSSDPKVLAAFPKDDIAENLQHVDFDDSPTQRTLGVVWDIVTDTFLAKAEIPTAEFTRRGVLKVVNSFYDPIGIASPVILSGRLIQRLVIPPKDKESAELQSCGWDDPLPEKFLPQWEMWKDSLRNAHLLKIPRCFIPKDFGEVVGRELHIFGDASNRAIGYVIYLRSLNNLGKIHIAFVTAGSRVAPRSATSIPRLELNAALLATNSGIEVYKEIDLAIDSVNYYTDSRVILGYLNNKSKSFSRYVTRRIESITKIAPPNSWNYIPTNENPADLASRPNDPDTLSKSSWLAGPQFLYSSELHPYVGQSEHLQEDDLPEEITIKTCLLTNTYESKDQPIGLLVHRISCWKRLIRVVSNVMQFCFKLINTIKLRSKSPQIKQLPVSKHNAEIMLILSAQKETYPEVFGQLNRNKRLLENHKICKLSPFLDKDNLLRVGGRIKNADLPFDHKHPILIPANHDISKRIIQYFHQEVGHQGRVVTHSYIRQQGYYLENGRRAIRDYLSCCAICKRLRAEPCDQLMADLPADRVERSPPFTNTGIDVFGPYFVHDGVNTRRTSATKKVHVLLLTCLVTRGIHLEMLPAMDTSSFQNALRRFFAIRGVCKRIRSDHGSNFIGAINQSVDVSQLQNEVESHQCVWELNPPGASHFGGPWERKIGAVRRVLDFTVRQSGNRVLSRDEMHTLLQEASAIVNSTPLCEISEDPNDPFPITPASLLTLKDDPNPSPPEVFKTTDLLQYGTKRWRRVQYLADQFWCRWRDQYLYNLNKRKKWKINKRNVRINDIVLLKDKHLPRHSWPLAKVYDTKLSNDGFVRSVQLKVAGKSKLSERCINDLILILPCDGS